MKKLFNIKFLKQKQSQIIDILFSFYLKTKNYKLKTDAGFTLLEAIVAIFILLVGTTGAMTLISRGIVGLNVSRENLIATNLAQEGLEIIHNIRDTNWLDSAAPDWNDWDDDGIADDCSSPCTGFVLWNSSRLEQIPFDLKWNNFSGHYDNIGVSEKAFYRIINIIDNPDGNLSTPDVRVVSTVGWGGDGSCISGGVPSNRKYCLTLEERLYNWR